MAGLSLVYQRMFESMIGLLGLNMMMMFGAVLIWDVHERTSRPCRATC